jgi:hypothetical protein
MMFRAKYVRIVPDMRNRYCHGCLESAEKLVAIGEYTDAQHYCETCVREALALLCPIPRYAGVCVEGHNLMEGARIVRPEELCGCHPSHHRYDEHGGKRCLSCDAEWPTPPSSPDEPKE